MIKKIPVSYLQHTMYLHERVADWIDQPFLLSRFLIRDQKTINKVVAAGVGEAYIDASRGLDIPPAPTADVNRHLEIELASAATALPPAAPITLASELVRAGKIRSQANKVMQSVMRDVRLGQALNLEQVVPVVEEITLSISRNPGALLSLVRLKTRDNYTFTHSVAVCALMVAFCQALKLDASTTREAGIGALLHDIGKMRVPEEILNKPGSLSAAEFNIMKRHPLDGYEILRATPGVGPVALDIALHHHERMHGNGYPDRLPASEISRLTQMAAIVDVYDAVTSDRCYHIGIPPAEALKRMWEWSAADFDPGLMRAFICTIGIYPVGTLVSLTSGRLAVVTELHPSRISSPTVRVFFSVRSNLHVRLEEIDLSHPYSTESIVSHEDPVKWGVDPLLYMTS